MGNTSEFKRYKLYMYVRDFFCKVGGTIYIRAKGVFNPHLSGGT